MKIEKKLRWEGNKRRSKYLLLIFIGFGLLFANFATINVHSENQNPWQDLPWEDKPEVEEKDDTERVIKAIPMIIFAMIIFFGILTAVAKRSWGTAGIIFVICGFITIMIALVNGIVFQASASKILLGIDLGSGEVEVHRGPGGLIGGCILIGLGILFWLHGR